MKTGIVIRNTKMLVTKRDFEPTAALARLRAMLVVSILVGTGFVAPAAQAQTGGGPERSPFIDSIVVDSTWQNVTASEGKPLRIHYQAIAFSGGGTANGRTIVFGGGHNNGMSDSVAVLDWRNFETKGWTEEVISTADHIGVDDENYAAISRYLNENYDGSTPGGIRDDRGLVALARHTYDQIVVRSDHFYMFAGILPYDNPGQTGRQWGVDEGDIWRYDFGIGWSFVGAPLALGYAGQAAAAEDTLTGDIWVHDGSGLRLFDPETGTVGPAGDYLNSQNIESHLNFNPEKGPEGTLFGAGTYAGGNWYEYDIATGQQRNMGAVPGSATTTYIIYVDSSYGPNYGSYFAFVPRDGTIRRWNGSAWVTIATGGPSSNDYVYGRGGFESVHQVFYWIHNPYTGNNAWQTHVVRPYGFNSSVSPAPFVTITADPDTVPVQGTSSLVWSATNADSCTASGDWSGDRPVSGSETVGPLATDRSFTLTCSGSGGESSGTAAVTVMTIRPAPIVDLSAEP